MWITGLFTARNVMRLVGGLLCLGGIAALYLGVLHPSFALMTLAVGLPLVATASLLDWFDGRARARESVDLALRIGWRYVDDMPGMFARLTVPPFTTDSGRYVDVMIGTFQGVECYDGIFEWRVRVDQEVTLKGTNRVTAVRLADELPRVMVVPEGIGGRLMKAVGGADKDFESAAFNRAWRVLADDSRIAHDMLSPRVLSALETQARPAPMLFDKGLGVRIGSDSERVGDLADRLAGLLAVARHLPQHVIDDHGRFANSPGPLPSVATPGALTGGYKPELAAADEQALREAAVRRQARKFSRQRTPGQAPRPMYGGDDT